MSIPYLRVPPPSTPDRARMARSDKADRTVGYLEEGCAEPLRLADRIDVDELVCGLVFSDARWRHRVGKVRTFMGGRGLSGDGVEYLPVRYGAIPRLFESGLLAVDVAYVQTDADLTLGVHSGYMESVLSVARSVVVERNRAMPSVRGAPRVERPSVVVDSDRPLIEVPRRRASDVDVAIAENVLTLVPSGATIEVGLGALPDAVLLLLAGKRTGLRFFSGMLGDSIIELASSGALADDELVTTTLIGTAPLFAWAASEPRLRLAPATEVHSVANLSRIDGFVALNSALEVDVTGQVGAEEVDGRRLSGLGGQADFAAGATLAPGGRSIIALPASRIVDQLSGPVSTPRVDVGFVVTERGVADLAGATLEEREARLRAVRA